MLEPLASRAMVGKTVPMPDPEVRERPLRRRFTAEYRRRIVEEAKTGGGLKLVLGHAGDEESVGPCVAGRGDPVVTFCPLGTHRDSEPSFTVFPDRHYHCFG